MRQPNTVCCPSRYFCILADANHCHQDRRTLPEVYSEQQSPRPPEDILRFFRAADISAKIGLRSSLLRYQQETVAAMANLEMSTLRPKSPLYTALFDVGGSKKLWYRPQTLEFIQECPPTEPSRGGILCEELGSCRDFCILSSASLQFSGTGKTIMVIALILATLHTLPAPHAISQPVMTPLSLRHFPDAPMIAQIQPDKTGLERGVPTLVELLLHKARASSSVMSALVPLSAGRFKDRTASFLSRINSPSLRTALQENVPLYFVPEPPPTRQPRQCNEEKRGLRRFFLSGATLLVIPSMLHQQWRQELLKHVDDGRLRVLDLCGGQEMPHVATMANEYDVSMQTGRADCCCFTDCMQIVILTYDRKSRPLAFHCIILCTSRPYHRGEA